MAEEMPTHERAAFTLSGAVARSKDDEDARTRRQDVITLQAQTAEALRLALTAPMVALLRSRLIACCHTAPNAEREVEAVLRDFGLNGGR